ncbi:MAG: MFS transporter, partial [bacterium]|nr:MFS transporter [bacterium]
RFCLYGFLKNQKYYEPFLILAFLEKGLSFFDIGLLIAFREVAINFWELPSGAVADLSGRRRAMIFSFASYLVSFVIFALSAEVWMLFVAMGFFALGEAFRSGTHKAMIFDWLMLEGRADEKAKVYGTTRSWSQLGSAVSVLIAAVIVIVEGSYTWIFWYSMVPYAAGLINFFGYPAELDGGRNERPSPRAVVRHLARALRQCWRTPPLRRLLVESTLHKGTYKTVKDYLQPLLQQSALLLPFLLALDDAGRAAVLVGAVYFGLYLLSALATRTAHRVRDAAGGAARATRRVWLVNGLAYLALTAALFAGWNAAAIALFVLLALLLNVWLPIYLERIDDASDREIGATLLSVDAQSVSVYVMLIAPALGWAVDAVGLWPVGVVGALAAAIVLVQPRPAPHDSQ